MNRVGRGWGRQVWNRAARGAAFRLLIVGLLCLVVGGCAKARVTSVRDPDFLGRQFSRPAVRALVDDPYRRQILEEGLVVALARQGIVARPAIHIAPPTRQYSQEEERVLLVQAGADSLVVINGWPGPQATHVPWAMVRTNLIDLQSGRTAWVAHSRTGAKGLAAFDSVRAAYCGGVAKQMAADRLFAPGGRGVPGGFPAPMPVTAGALGNQLSVPDIVQRSRPGVVLISAGSSRGTGFVVASGVVATNLHVVEGAREIRLQSEDGREYAVTHVVGWDQGADLALLYAPSATAFPILPLRDDDGLRPGDSVIAIGNPRGLEGSVSTGVVSALRPLDDTITLIQTTAAISPGSSGGPLLDEYGRVVGVTTLAFLESQNLNFAVPAIALRRLLVGRSLVDLARFATETAPRATPKEAFPTMVAGFQLGGTLDAAHRTCRRARGEIRQWDDVPGFSVCSAVPVDPFGSVAFSGLIACGSGSARRLCGVDLVFAEESSADARRILDRLEAKYGQMYPSPSDHVCPEASLRSTSFRGTWRWTKQGGDPAQPTGWLAIEYGCQPGVPTPRLRLLYRDATGFALERDKHKRARANF